MRRSQDPLKVSYEIAKLGGHRHCDSGDIMVLICQVISKDHLIKVSSNFMVGTPHRKSPPYQVRLMAVGVFSG